MIPIVSQLRHVKEKLVSAQTRHTTRQNPRRVLFEILSNDLLKSFNVLIRSLPFRRLHFITLSKHKSQRYLIITTTNNQRETPQEKEKKHTQYWEYVTYIVATEPIRTIKINLLRRNTCINQKKHTNKCVSIQEVTFSKRRPIRLHSIWHFSKPITRQIHNVPTLIHQEVIDKLSLSCLFFSKLKINKNQNFQDKGRVLNQEPRTKKQTRFLGSESDFFFTDQTVDKRWFSDIGTTQDGNLGKVVFRTVSSTSAALDELDLFDLGVARERSDYDVGARKHHIIC